MKEPYLVKVGDEEFIYEVLHDDSDECKGNQEGNLA
jgi:hypothetical protein